MKYFFHGDPFLTPELVVIGADGGSAAGVTGHVHAFERGTGRQRWASAAGPGVWGAIAGRGRLVYALSGAGQLLALERESGALRWSFPVSVSGWPGPTAVNGRVIVGARDGSLHALDADTGRVEWRADIGAPITTSVAAATQGLYVGTRHGTIARIAPAKGALVASHKLDAKLKPASALVQAGSSLLVLLTDEGENYRALVSLDPTLSRTIWRQDASDRWTTTRVFVWRATAIVGTAAGEVVAYCTADGTKAWTHTVRGTVRAVGGSEDAIYVSTMEGILYAVRPPASCKPS